MDRASPPVSPRVVAQILIIQNARVTGGTFEIQAGSGLLASARCSTTALLSSPRALSPSAYAMRQDDSARGDRGPSWKADSCHTSIDSPGGHDETRYHF